MRKGNDTNVKNTIVEYLNANIRYYTTRNYLPWSTKLAGNLCGTAGTIPTSTLALITPCMTNLINDGELKSNFTSATAILNRIRVTATTNSATACFIPQSKAGKLEPNTKYTRSGTPQATNYCKSEGGTATTCYYCASI